MEKIRWGFIGAGDVVETKSGAAFDIPDKSEIYAICRRDLDKAKSSAEKFGANKYYDGVDNLLADDSVDAVYIATPPGLHLKQAQKCCAAGKPTYIEKPLARNYDEARQIVEMYAQAKVPLFVAHYRRALPRFIKIKSLLTEQTIGEITEVDFHIDRRFKAEDANLWRYNISLSGGGKFYDIAPHSIDILVYLLGDFAEINSFATNHYAAYKAEDVVVMNFKSVGGILGSANFNSISLWKEDKCVIYGTEGRLTFSMHDDDTIKIETAGKTEKISLPDPPLIQAKMVAEVVEELRTGQRQHTCHGDDALETYRIMDEALKDYYGGRENGFWERFSK
jgi:predicted dehydrogenase